MPENRRKRDSAKLVWDSKPKRAPNPKDIEFQTAELVIPNAAQANQFNLPIFNQPQAGVTSLFPGQMGELLLGEQEIDKSQMNRLIWGDNLLAMQALLAQGYAGKIDLIYIDPPFLSSADYNFQLSVEGKKVTKEASIIERLAYTDTWEGGMDSFIDMLYPRLQLIKRLLSDKGSIYVHVDWRVVHYLKLILDEIFSINNYRNDIKWKRQPPRGAKAVAKQYARNSDSILFYSKSDSWIWNGAYKPYEKSFIETKFRKDENGRLFRDCDLGDYSEESIANFEKQGKIYVTSSGKKRLIRYLDEEKGEALGDIWTDIAEVNSMAEQRNDFPTQKPEALLERIIKASSKEGDLVADFFCGSGTTMAVADRLNRRWIGCNLDKVGLQVSRNRLVAQQSSPFLLENIGNYQRQMIYLSGSKIGEMQRIILKLYGAQARTDRPDLGVRTHDDGTTELVYVGYPDRPTTAKKVMELAKDAEVLDGTGYKTLIILAWDYDYNFSTDLENYGKTRKVKTDIQPLTIPPEIYNYLKKAKNEDDLEGLRDKLVFHEKPYLKVSHGVTDAGDGQVMLSVAIDRYVLLNFPVPEKQQAELRKVIKDNFAVLIDYWAVDWDYDGKLFKSQWQAIRGNGKRTHTVVTSVSSLPMKSGKRSIAIRLVDIFGNDASATINFTP
ncbi:site-specific DNA-methyltransferase [Synechocystis sp. FACHB-383]|uniref:site-specific DNA-methyltransferase n=1 Tax=Synechocystis sp. FACHB-383 TaxID=2692864 RepID=UPI0016861987|nr:site-specific DNA-methyltransferase [Synechocystis sp. FACHB-383]MBD2652859.1 site-specific DNA-methyltransferase [Synechocystis sp. FACHB-383]